MFSDIEVCDIIQVAAVHRERSFNAYTVPRRALTDSATRVTGFTVRRGNLLLHGAPVDTIPLNKVLTSFISFLRSFQRPVFLAAHNAKRFDAPVINRVLQQCHMLQDFQQVVAGFVDTFLLSKNLFKCLPSYSQQYMVQYFLEKTYNAHDAMEDARMLQELFRSWNPSRFDVQRCTFMGSRMYF